MRNTGKQEKRRRAFQSPSCLPVFLIDPVLKSAMELTFFRRFALDICILVGMGPAREPKEYTDGPSEVRRCGRRKPVASVSGSCENGF
jgi:hypothetical protein